MTGFLLGARDIPASFQKGALQILEQKTGIEANIEASGEGVIIASNDHIDQGDLLVGFDGYLLGTEESPETRIAEKFRRHGPELAREVNGAFRTVIYDKQKERFHATADRAGRKTVYFTRDADRFTCCSHLTPLLRHPEIETEIDSEAVADFLRSWSTFFSGGRHLVKGISQLYPSHRLIHSGKTQQHQFWDVRREKRDISDREAVERLDELLSEGAREITEKAESPLNVTLSGGFDSTFLVSLLREVSEHDIETYTWGWREDHFKDAREMSELYGTDHNEIELSHSFMDDEELFFYEQPHNAFERYPFYEMHRDGISSFWTGLNSQATFPVCLKNIRRLDGIKKLEPLMKLAPEGAPRFIQDNISYKLGKAAEILESDFNSTAAIIDWGASRKEGLDLIASELERDNRTESEADERWELESDSYQENYNYLQLRMRDTARYAYYAQYFEHYDLYGYLPALEFSYSLPMSQKKNRRLLQKIAEGRVPNRIITKGASGWDFVTEQFKKKITNKEESYRTEIRSFMERGYTDEKAAERLLLPDSFCGESRGKINQMLAVYLLERWMQIFIDREEPWKPPV